MLRFQLILVLLLTACFGLGAWLEPLQATEAERTGRSESFLALLLGEGRALFANEVFAKADAYFHRGNYPSIFDTAARREDENHMLGETREKNSGESEAKSEDHQDQDNGEEHHDHDHGDGNLEESRAHDAGTDWIERFARKFRAASHVHLEKGREREMLPWLKLSSELNPHGTEAFTVAAYWLRELDRVDEAERFLRDGLRKNPNHPELLNELAWLAYAERHDHKRARHLWRAALRRWLEVERPKEEPNLFVAQRILGGLAQLERQDGNLRQAIDYLRQLKMVSPNPDAVQRLIDSTEATIESSPQ